MSIQRSSSLRLRQAVITAILSGLVIATLWFVGFLKFSDTIPQYPMTAYLSTDAIVVLTGGSGRLEAGLDLLSDNPKDRLFISGVYQGIDVTTLLQIFRDGPTELEGRVEIGNATNTRENAIETADWVNSHGIQSIRLVTAAYHMPRSLLEFRYAMPNILLYPYPVFPDHVKSDWWLWPGSAELVFKEYNKFLVAWIYLTLGSLFQKPATLS